MSNYTTVIRRCVWKTLNKKGDVKFIRTVWMRSDYDSFDANIRAENETARMFGGDKLGSLPTYETRKGHDRIFRSVKTDKLDEELAKLNSDPMCLVDPSEPFED